MSPQNRSRTLASWLLAGAVAGLLPGCSFAGRGLRLSESPAARPRTERGPNQQPFELMPPPASAKKANSDSTSSQRDGRKTSAVRVSPDGRWVAYESNGGGVHGVWIARRDGSEPRRVSGASLAILPSWSPDGSHLLFVARSFTRPDIWGIWIVEMGTTRVNRVASVGSVQIAGASWFPDNRHVCYPKADRLVVLDISTGAASTLHVPSNARPIVGVPAVSPEGGRIVFAVASDGVWLASLGDGRVQRLISERDVDAFAWAPGGRQIAFRSARDGQWKLYIVEP